MRIRSSMFLPFARFRGHAFPCLMTVEGESLPKRRELQVEPLGNVTDVVSCGDGEPVAITRSGGQRTR